MDSLNPRSARKQPLHPIDNIPELTSFLEANKDVNWRNVMCQEITTLHPNGTCALVLQKSCMNIVGCIWVFKLKRRVDGYIDCYKACLVAKGFHQQEGIGYHETFSLVVKPYTIRTMLNIVLSMKWHLHQLGCSKCIPIWNS